MDIQPADLIATASIIVGFGVTVVMFRVQRELDLQENNPGEPTWLAWADYLILAAVTLAVVLVILPLLALPGMVLARAIARGACAAALILLWGYIPAILAHYRIEIGRNRTDLREKGEPWERKFVLAAAILAVIAFALVSLSHITAAE